MAKVPSSARQSATHEKAARELDGLVGSTVAAVFDGLAIVAVGFTATAVAVLTAARLLVFSSAVETLFPVEGIGVAGAVVAATGSCSMNIVAATRR